MHLAFVELCRHSVLSHVLFVFVALSKKNKIDLGIVSINGLKLYKFAFLRGKKKKVSVTFWCVHVYLDNASYHILCFEVVPVLLHINQWKAL